MMSNSIVDVVLREKAIAIIRGVGFSECIKVAEALYAGGIRLMEVTFALDKPELFPETAQTIRSLVKTFHGRAIIGAGTVTYPMLVDLAADAGAAFIVSPDANPEVIRHTKARSLTSIPGAMTPTEILSADAAGADFVKLFPAGELGISYVKAILSPISHVRLLAVGGVGADNAAAFLRAGVKGVGVGGNLVNKQWIAEGAFEKLTRAAEELTAAVRDVSFII